jgi:acyl-CoA synthetase (AMP-forming)/AMP-acid ligase II
LSQALHDGLRHVALESGDRIGLCFGRSQFSYRDIDVLSDGFAHLLNARGVRPGARVAVSMASRPDAVFAVYGISKLGAAAVMVSPAWKLREVEHALDLTAPTHAVGDAPANELFASLLDEEHCVNVDQPGFSDQVLGHPAAPIIERDWSTAEAALVFSSGTTGMPKAVRHTHGSVGVAVAHWRSALGLTQDDRFQVATPLAHILGLLNVLTAMATGARIRVHRRFDIDEALHCVATERLTLEMAVAPIALAMAEHPGLEKMDLTSLRYIMWGATPVTESVARSITERTGVRFLPAYGASELPVITANPVDEPFSWRLDSAGLPVGDVRLRVTDLQSGTPLDTGGIGEIEAMSASVMTGYLPEAANGSAFSDGWYRTGDVGWIEPEGWLHLTDRVKEMIKVKGFQVAPAEIEAVLHGHSAVADCAVFGVEDDRTGEAVVAAVQLREGAELARGELEAMVAAELAHYKQIAHVVVVDVVPRLPSGKVLRRVLKEEWSPRLELDS